MINYIEGEDEEFINEEKRKEVKRLKATGLLKIDTIIDIVNGKKDEAQEIKMATDIIADRQKKAKEEAEKKKTSANQGGIVQALKDKQKKDYEKNVAVILKDIDSINDSADFKKIKGYKKDGDKMKGFTRLYKEFVKDKKYDKFTLKDDEDTIKDVFGRLKASGLF